MKDKEEHYKLILKQAASVLENENNFISIMATLCGILKQEFESFYWVGFYIEEGSILKIGPYQGTIACLTIEPEKGVCGRAFRTALTQIVDNVHDDPQHIACDPKSNSEIVVPVINKENKTIAVLDIDSENFNNFNEMDQFYLEQLIKQSFNSNI